MAICPADPNEYFFREYIQPGVLSRRILARGSHCMTRASWRIQLVRSLRNMGVDGVDVFYLHNPGTQLPKSPGRIFSSACREAFTFLESRRWQEKFNITAIATWNAFRQEPRAQDSMQLAELVQIAQEIAGGRHRFRLCSCLLIWE